MIGNATPRSNEYSALVFEFAVLDLSIIGNPLIDLRARRGCAVVTDGPAAVMHTYPNCIGAWSVPSL